MSNTFLFAQYESDNDMSQYFDDGRKENENNIVKLNLSSIVIGDLPIFYERVLFLDSLILLYRTVTDND